METIFLGFELLLQVCKFIMEMRGVKRMVPYELQHLTLMQIDIFLRCAEQMNFTKVAEKLNITPSMVSKKISAMESSLGFNLFLREKNRVSLTSEGEALYAAWRQPVKIMMRQAAEIKGRRKADQTISFSLWESTNLERFFVPMISAFSAEQELAFRIKLHEGFEGMEAVMSGKSDVAFIPKFAELGIPEMKVLDYFLAVPSPLYAAMSSEHPLSKKKTLQVEDLMDVSIIHSDDTVIWYTDMIRGLCQQHGFEPKFYPVDSDRFKILYLSMDDKLVLITDKYYHAFASNAVEYRELMGTERGLLMVYRKDAPNHVRHFVEFARRFYRELR